MFSFVMEVEGLDFRAALEHLARQAGLIWSSLNPLALQWAGQKALTGGLRCRG